MVILSVSHLSSISVYIAHHCIGLSGVVKVSYCSYLQNNYCSLMHRNHCCSSGDRHHQDSSVEWTNLWNNRGKKFKRTDNIAFYQIWSERRKTWITFKRKICSRQIFCILVSYFSIPLSSLNRIGIRHLFRFFIRLLFVSLSLKTGHNPSKHVSPLLRYCQIKKRG